MKKKRLELGFSDEDYEFLEKLSKRDEVTIQEEMKMIFFTEFNHCKELYKDELMGVSVDDI